MPPTASPRIADEQYAEPFAGQSLDLLMDALPYGLLYMDASLRIQHCNRRCADWLGASAAALRGRDAVSALGGPHWHRVEPHLRRTLNGEHSTLKHMLATPGHGELRLETACVPDRNPRGHVRGVLLWLTDVTLHAR